MKVLLPHEIFLGFFWTSGLASWANDLFHLLAQSLVSKKVSIEHSSSYTDKGVVTQPLIYDCHAKPG